MLAKMALILLVFQFQQPPPVASRPHPTRESSTNLRTAVHDYHLSAGNLVEALIQVGTEFQIPMGIEWVRIPNAKAQINLSFKDATVQQVLQAIVDGQPGAKMIIQKDIVHVFASELIPDGENPLKLNINEFKVHDVPAELASRQLHETIKRTLLPPQPQQGFERRGGVGGSGFSNSDDPKISVTLKNATVEDILDALALSSTRKIWIVTFSDSHTLTAAGYRRTLGLWTSSTVPDEEQPVWDMFHWRDALPATLLGDK